MLSTLPKAMLLIISNDRSNYTNIIFEAIGGGEGKWSTKLPWNFPIISSSHFRSISLSYLTRNRKYIFNNFPQRSAENHQSSRFKKKKTKSIAWTKINEIPYFVVRFDPMIWKKYIVHRTISRVYCIFFFLFFRKEGRRYPILTSDINNTQWSPMANRNPFHSHDISETGINHPPIL